MQTLHFRTIVIKTSLFITGFLFIALFTQAQQKAVGRNPNDEKAVLQTERELLQARIDGDTVTLNRLLADNYLSSDSLTKQNVITNLKPMQNTRLDTSSIKVHSKGNSANVTAVLVRNLPPFGDTYWQVVENLVKHSGQWQSVSMRREMLPVWKGKRYNDSEMTELIALPCIEKSGMKSLNSEQPTMLKFTNTMAQPIIIRWINFEGELDTAPYLVNTILSGESMTIATFVTHPFVATDKAGKCLGIFKPNPEPSLAIIK